MAERIILHIGLHKTGSTAIQEAMQGYDDGRVVYADLENPNHSVALSAAFRSDAADLPYFPHNNVPHAEVDALGRDTRARIERMAADAEGGTLLLSGEDASSFKADDKRALIRFLRDHAKEVSVIAYVRPPLEVAASSFSEQIKQRPWNGWIRILSPRYRTSLETFMTCVDDMTVRPYARTQLVGGDIVKDYCALVRADYRKTRRRNDASNMAIPGSVIKLMNAADRELDGRTTIHLGVLGRTRVSSVLTRGLGNQPRAPLGLFDHAGLYVDTIWLKDNFGIDFTPDVPVTASQEDVMAGIDAYLADLPAELPKRLRDLCRSEGLRISRGAGIGECLERLYEHVAGPVRPASLLQRAVRRARRILA